MCDLLDCLLWEGCWATGEFSRINSGLESPATSILESRSVSIGGMFCGALMPAGEILGGLDGDGVEIWLWRRDAYSPSICSCKENKILSEHFNSLSAKFWEKTLIFNPLHTDNRFSSNSASFAAESLENLEEMLININWDK